jgi:hypothetical protein
MMGLSEIPHLTKICAQGSEGGLVVSELSELIDAVLIERMIEGYFQVRDSQLKIWKDKAIALESALRDAEDKLKEHDEYYRRVVNEECAPDELHCTCVPALRAEIAELRADLEHIGELTGIAGVDEPMSVTDCVIALKETKEASDEQHDYLSDAGRGFLDGRNFDTLVVDPPEFFNETREDEASDAE